MITSKDRYLNALIVHKLLERTLENAIVQSKQELRLLQAAMQAECSHENKFYEDTFDYHKREDWVVCHCKDCGKYLGRK